MGKNNSTSCYTIEELEKIRVFKEDLKKAKEKFMKDTYDKFGCNINVAYIVDGSYGAPQEFILENIQSIDMDIVKNIENDCIPREIKVAGMMSDLILDCAVFYTDIKGETTRIFPSINNGKVTNWDSITSSEAIGLFRFLYVKESNAIYVHSNVEDDVVTNSPEINECARSLFFYTKTIARLIQKLCNNVFRGELKYV